MEADNRFDENILMMSLRLEEKYEEDTLLDMNGQDMRDGPVQRMRSGQVNIRPEEENDITTVAPSMGEIGTAR